MKQFRFAIILFLTLPFCASAQLETTQVDNVFFVRMLTGMNLIEMPLPASPQVEIIVYVKTGSMYEGDTTNGMANLIENMIATKLTSYLHNKNNPTISYLNTSINCQSTTEHAIYKISTQPAGVQSCIDLIRDSIFKIKFDESEIDTGINKVLQIIENNKYDNRKVFESKLIKLLYTQDHQRLEIYGKPDLLKSFTAKAVNEFFKKYYIPNNTLITITGPIVAGTTQQQFENSLLRLVNYDFNPETISKINGMRPIAYTSQFVVEDSVSNPEIQICWQFPGMLTNRESSFPAFLLAQMLNDKNNFIQVKAKKMGCQKFQVEYDANNFNGILRVILQPSKKNFFDTYQFVVREMDRLNETILNDEMMNVAKLQFRKDYQILKKTKEYPAWIVKSWAFDNESYFPELSDSVFSVSKLNLRSFIMDYLNQSPHVSGLLINRTDRQELKVDSVFPEIDQAIKKYVFKYRPNITDLEGEDNKTMEQNLLQWLLINNDVSVQVNGFSDEHEYNRTYDDSVMQFIDSLPTFQQAMPDIVKKHYLRPATMRAMKIVKFLYDHGIQADRLSGTSMMFKSANKQEEEDNRKCTLTLNKYLKSPSLFEARYGKKKEQ